jgi:Holliday junction DNA helicase RuvA
MGILSTLKPDDLRLAIISEDAKAIAQAPGIGPKTAKRVILELKDKIRMEDILPGGDMGAAVDLVSPMDDTTGSGAQGAAKEAIEALVALGYSLSEATRAVRQVALTDEMDTEAVLKASLKFLVF